MPKRKRKESVDASHKKPKIFDVQVDHPVLSRYYPRLLSLRQYLVERLPGSSKKRRRKLQNYGRHCNDPSPGSSNDSQAVCELLDNTIVGFRDHVTKLVVDDGARIKEHKIFTQQLTASASSIDGVEARFMQSEVVDFVIWLLFRRNPSATRPQHLLCTGFQRGRAPGQDDEDVRLVSAIPGIVSNLHNPHVDTMKNATWSTILRLLGDGGDKIMTNLLLECGIFCGVDARRGYYYQLSGTPLIDKKRLSFDSQQSQKCVPDLKTLKNNTSLVQSHADIKLTDLKLIRSRMMYYKGSLVSTGQVKFGLQRIHVLNRLSDTDSQEQLVHTMKYIFPRQFRLHNVFTSKVDPKDTALPLKDYTLREKEISQQYTHKSAESIRRQKTTLPKRLRGEAARLVGQLRKLHARCPYHELLHHYCPVEGIDSVRNTVDSSRKGRLGPSKPLTKPVAQVDFTELATPVAQVSAFCKSVISNVVPKGFWGDKNVQSHNYRRILRSVDEFIKIRKYETLSLHQLVQGLKIDQISWLRPLSTSSSAKLSASDFTKRRELLHEFVYYIFDSFLIPLIRTNFHVTESNVHKQRLFFFRHDVWRMLAEPSLSLMKLTMFEEIKGESASKLLASRYLGYSQIRLLPKKTGARPIMNLRRRMQMNRNGRKILGRSINSTLAPAFSVLNYEKATQPEKLGSSLFSVGDIFPRLRAFRKTLQQKELWTRPLYFCKVDVTSCFDTIPQQRLVEIIDDLMTSKEYNLRKHVEMGPGGTLHYFEGTKGEAATVSKFKTIAGPAGRHYGLEERIHKAAQDVRAQTILVDLPVQQQEKKRRIVSLIREHIKKNLVKIGRKFYRQKNGIPQGSVVSTLLCSLFYAELEHDHLAFLTRNDSALMRLLDDFLLVTTDRRKAERFLRIMHEGRPEYGLEVKIEKSLASFEAVIDGARLRRPSSEAWFPYCGILINTRTLEVRKNADQQVTSKFGDALTVDTTRVPGQTFHRKTLNGFKMRTAKMFLDGEFNRPFMVLSNLYESFKTTAERSWEYLKCLGAGRRRTSGLLIKTLNDLITLAHLKVRNANRHGKWTRVIRLSQIKWLALHAFHQVYLVRQTRFNVFVHWLRLQLDAARPGNATEWSLLQRAVDAKM